MNERSNFFLLNRHSEKEHISLSFPTALQRSQTGELRHACGDARGSEEAAVRKARLVSVDDLVIHLLVDALLLLHGGHRCCFCVAVPALKLEIDCRNDPAKR